MKVKRLTLLILLTMFLSSCACYHCPRVYKNRVGVPTPVDVPLKKNTKQNKYGPKKPYYGKIETRKNKKR